MLVQLSESKRREIEEGNEKLQNLKIKGLIDGKIVEEANKLQPRQRLALMNKIIEGKTEPESIEKEYDDKTFSTIQNFYWKPGRKTSVPKQFMV